MCVTLLKLEISAGRAFAEGAAAVLGSQGAPSILRVNTHTPLEFLFLMSVAAACAEGQRLYYRTMGSVPKGCGLDMRNSNPGYLPRAFCLPALGTSQSSQILPEQLVSRLEPHGRNPKSRDQGTSSRLSLSLCTASRLS